MKLARCIAAAVAAIVAIYLIAGFYTWEFNPGRWSEDTRAFFVMQALLWAWMAAAGASELGRRR